MVNYDGIVNLLFEYLFYIKFYCFDDEGNEIFCVKWYVLVEFMGELVCVYS